MLDDAHFIVIEYSSTESLLTYLYISLPFSSFIGILADSQTIGSAFTFFASVLFCHWLAQQSLTLVYCVYM